MPPSSTESQNARSPHALPARPGAGTKPLTLAVLISGGGTTLQNLIDRIAAGTLNARIGVVIASRADVNGVVRARAAGLPVVVVPRKDYASPEAFGGHLFAACEGAGVGLMCLAGWLQLLPIPPAWEGRVMNIHPALLPKYGGRGMFGRHVHAAVLAAGEAESGCTVHFVNNEYDAGPIILRRTCPVLAGDTPDTLAARVFEAECTAYPEAITAYTAGQVRLEHGAVIRR